MSILFRSDSKTAMESKLAIGGIFLRQKDCSEETFRQLFTEHRTSVCVRNEEYMRIARNIAEEINIMKENFQTAVEQKRLRRSFKRFILQVLYNQNVLGFRKTLSLIHALVSHGEDYYLFLTDPYVAALPAFSTDQQSTLALGYSRLLNSELDNNSKLEILGDIDLVIMNNNLELTPNDSELIKDYILSIENPFEFSMS